MAFKVFFDSPEKNKGKLHFHYKGGSPKLVDELIRTIEENKNDILEINLAWYLFNNWVLHDYLKRISKEGIIVNVITIPLEGYDNSNPKKLKLENGDLTDISYTKYDLAKSIFHEIFFCKDLPNYNIYFFPHIYLRSSYVKKFSRGNFPYSLHLKAGYIKKKEGEIIAISSSNMAVRDLTKFESLLIIEDESAYQVSFRQFFGELLKNSINIKNFSTALNTANIDYPHIPSPSGEKAFFTAPFYFDSSNRLEDELLKILSGAKEKIIICAQHLAAFNYKFKAQYHSQIKENQMRQGILGKILELAKTGIRVTCLSQTFAPPDSLQSKFENHNFRAPSNKVNFKNFIDELEKTNSADYFVNKNIHSKFIIVDDLLVFCTYNFTPTQFSYLDSVEIDQFTHMPDMSYKGIHCEVSAHVIVDNDDICASFNRHVRTIIDADTTIKVL
ncbi:hypothetical protein ACFSKL_06080 [Belliella marina]|uniref:PLD phosphodiesterase domain-containing protein n=1 Tax=Belliella marina TaxID=1644146 RepID=A0ABW4VJS3_9BACT